MKKVLLKIWQNLQDNNCVGVRFLKNLEALDPHRYKTRDCDKGFSCEFYKTFSICLF